MKRPIFGNSLLLRVWPVHRHRDEHQLTPLAFATAIATTLSSRRRLIRFDSRHEIQVLQERLDAAARLDGFNCLPARSTPPLATIRSLTRATFASTCDRSTGARGGVASFAEVEGLRAGEVSFADAAGFDAGVAGFAEVVDFGVLNRRDEAGDGFAAFFLSSLRML